MRRRTFAIVLLASMVVTLGAFAHARPTYRSALERSVGAPLAKKLNDCRTCHAPAASDSQVNARTLNGYGQRLRRALPELRAAKKRAGISNRLNAIADEDTDGDGVSNLIELRSGHFPGDPADTPTPEEREKANAQATTVR